ncbi:MAG: FecR domain-containing protein [Pseudomonadales bacterium]|nr:FecR domain-containing protein [Pseudomonadales bacterium]
MMKNESQIAELLQKVGARADPPTELTSEIKANVKLAWQDEVAMQALKTNSLKRSSLKRKIGMTLFAIAASLFIAVGMNMSDSPLNQAETIATVTKSVNQVEYKIESGEWQNIGQTLIAASYKIRTGSNSYTSLRLQNGMDVRVGEDTEIEIVNLDTIFLSTGTLYVDSNSTVSGSETDISIRTPFGQAVDIGTQFLVQVTPQQWRVQVRDGKVEMKDDNEVFLLESGYRLEISESDTVTKSPIESHDDSWQWIKNVSAPFQLEGATLDHYLEWISKESGKKIKYRSESAHEAASKTILHGSATNLASMDTLSNIISTTDFIIIESTQSSIVIDR